MKSLKKGLILFAILIFPSLAYLLMTTGKNQYKRLQIFGPKELSGTTTNGVADTIYHHISDFKLLNQENKVVSLADLTDKIIVADFFFTSCQTICPKMTGSLQKVQDKFAAARDLRILSFTVDPERDSVSTLANYGKKHLVNNRKWNMLTGSKEEIYDLARNSFYVTALPGDGGPDDFIHDDKLVLVDKEKRIRGYYIGTDSTDVKRLMDEITVLMIEYKEQKKK